jgi:hypothetical protein
MQFSLLTPINISYIMSNDTPVNAKNIDVLTVFYQCWYI